MDEESLPRLASSTQQPLCAHSARCVRVFYLFLETASKLISFLNHFLPNCFQFLVVHTVYSSGLAVYVL